MSRKRNREYDTVHHLTSRIAHRVFFLREEERNDFMDLMRRVSAFSGIEPVGWCVLDNHFHLYVYLPEPRPLSDADVLARLAALKGHADRALADDDADRDTDGTSLGGRAPDGQASPLGATGRRVPEDMFARLRRRMYSVPEYMKMIKQWFSEDYNARNGHKGTMWEATYGDRTLDYSTEDMVALRDTLAYVHLNPIRAAVSDRFDGYAWSSYTDFLRGDVLATRGMRLAYPGMSDDEIASLHEDRMRRLLKDEQLKRAEEIARKRQAGYEIPADHLTTEAMVAQAAEQIRRAQTALVELQAERAIVPGARARREAICRQIVMAVVANPESTPQSLSATLDVPLRTVQRYVGQLVRGGTLSGVAGAWRTKVGAEGQTFRANFAA